jgi:F0F1-type ATP synthase assembly protein I
MSMPKEENSKVQEGWEYLIFALGQASKISFYLVIFPIAFLFAGVFIDKKLNTKPLFIVVGIIAGVAFTIYKILRISKEKYFKDDRK